ncbi:MAG: IS66 family insertion sequence element accessory protein TnpB [Muribaculaceae bacterium]|nr:IS66 family insertion sequence element accessory protein TnpB [Muribaculaceae bacterium]
MFRVSDEMRFYLYTGRVNLRGGCLRLFQTVKTEMRSNPYDERNVFIFMNKARTIVRLVHYERGFYVMYEKRPSQGRFRKPVYESKTGRYQIGYTDLVCLTEGLARTEIRLEEVSPEPSK